MEYIIKLQISNSVNDDVTIIWNIFDNIEDKEYFIESHKIEQEKWNKNTPGARSWRYYSFREFTGEQILDLPLEELKGMTLKQFKSLL